MTFYRKTLIKEPPLSRKSYKFSSKIALLLLLPRSTKIFSLLLVLLLGAAIFWQLIKINLKTYHQEPQIEVNNQTIRDTLLEPRLCYECCNIFNATNSDLPIYSTYSTEEITNQITLLEKNLEVSPKNTCLINNLAVVYFIRGNKTESFSDTVQALSLIDLALSIKPDLLEALFNRPLVLKHLYLPLQAKSAWEIYLKKETANNSLAKINNYSIASSDKTPLAPESWEQQIKKLHSFLPGAKKQLQQLVFASPHQARMYALNELLPKWANSYLVKDIKTSYESLWLTRQIGINLFTLHKDNLINDLIKTIDLQSSSKSEENLFNLAKAYLIYQKANKTFEDYQVTSMDAEISKALEIFTKLNDKAGEILIILFTTKWERDFSYALSKLEKISPIAEKRGYPYLSGLIWRNIGSFQGQLFQSALAFDSQNKALAYFERCEDLEGIATSHFIISEILSQINDKEQIFFHQKKALLSLNNYPTETSKKALFLSAIGSQLQKLAKLAPAIYFHNEAISLSTNVKNNVVSSNIFLRRSLAYYSLGNKEFAFDDFNKAKNYCDGIEDPLLKNLTQEYINIIEGDYKLKEDPKSAIELFSLSLNKYKNYSDHYYLTHIYQSRAKAYSLLGNQKLALKDLSQGIIEFEKQRESIFEQSQKISFFEEPQPIYEQMVELQIAQGDIKKAFDYLEKARARSLLDSIKSSSPVNNNTSNTVDSGAVDADNHSSKTPFSLSEIQKILPTNTLIIEYSIMEDQIFAWVVSKNKVSLVKIMAKLKDVDYFVENIRSAIENNKLDKSLKTSSEELYKLLISPLTKHIPSSANLVIVADKSLNSIPFSILSNPQTNRYLIQDWPITHAPSAAIFAQCLIKDKELAKNDDKSILIIGSPNISKKFFPNLSDIPFVVKEAQEVKKIYEKSSLHGQYINFALFLDKTATKMAFYRNANNYSTIHFAGHAVENIFFPLHSYLVFTASDFFQSSANDSAMYAYELHRYRFTKTRLAVLSACHTGIGQNKLGEGNISLARSFLAAKIPSVIASLWQTDDELSAEFFIKFHQKKLLGLNNLEALSRTQNEFITNPNPKYQSPIVWGAFVLLGGSTLMHQ